MVGATGFEPATTCTPRQDPDAPRVPPAPTASPALHVSRGSGRVTSGSGSIRSTDSPETKRRGLPVVPRLRALDEVLTVREVAELLKVSTATVYAMVERGELEHFRVMNSIRVRREAVQALLERR
ncbi:MAG: helix-turn-helix domain-containing protein [Myxococcaceae bacterium]|nr:helix-turn-helix domain-containing protein [Myxococcaceae bacterium]